MHRRLKIKYILGLNIRWVAHEWLALHLDHSKFEVDFITEGPLCFIINKRKL